LAGLAALWAACQRRRLLSLRHIPTLVRYLVARKVAKKVFSLKAFSQIENMRMRAFSNGDLHIKRASRLAVPLLVINGDMGCIVLII